MSGTIIEALAGRLAAHGVRRFFGIPGGDCSLDLIEAAARHGIEFTVTRTEAAAALMAMATAQLTGAPGVLMTTRGPGLANAVNGIAAAALDRAPLLVLADGHEPNQAHASHQRFDQAAVVRPLVKAESMLAEADPTGEFDRLIAAACAPPQGPVYVELIGARIRAPAPPRGAAPPPAAPASAPDGMAAARAVLQASRRPVIIAGLQAAAPEAAASLRRLAAAWGAPVLSTYMAKGAIADSDPLAVGPFIAGAAEDALIRSADAILLFGADPIEFLPQPWRYQAPAVMLTTHAFDRAFADWAATVVGSLADGAGLLADAVRPGGWSPAEIAAARTSMRDRARLGHGGEAGITPQALVEALAAAAPPGTRLAVDAGAHMLPVMALWQAEMPRGVLISRGLATMGSGLPAAIAASLAEPDRMVVCCTGDGGLMMCAAELATAVQAGCRKLVTIVFNDATMAMIEVKQRRRQLPPRGMGYGATDFATVARGFGCIGLRADRPEELPGVLREAFASECPVVVDVAIDREAYATMLPALRG